MNPFCEEAVAKVAAGLGKKIPAGYMRGIDDKFASTARYLASVDKDGFRAKDAKGRMEAVADAIEQDIRHKAIKDAQRAELNAIKQDTRKGELRAMLGEGQGGISSLQKMIGFIAEASSRKSTSIETAIKVEQNAYLRGIEELLNADNGAHFLGYLVDPQKSKVLIRELFGENTGDADARLLAETYRKSNKQQLDNYNKEGGDIAPLEGYIPLSLDPMKLWGSTFDWSNGLPRRMTQQERMKKWVDFEITLVDRNRMVDLNGKPMDDAGLRKFLEESWWTRVTDGRIKSRGESGLSSGIANRHKKHKQIFYKDADSFMAAMEKGGGGNIFENIISHTNKLAGEMAIMRQLGPNAYETYSQLRDMAIEADKASFKLDESKLNQTDRMFDLLMGLGGGIEGNPNVHRFFRNIKDISGAHLLGSIISSQLADNGTALSTMRYLGVALDDWGILKGDFYTNPELKRWAKDNVVLFDAMTNNLARWGDMATSTTIPSKLLSSVYRISGANALTVNHRQSVAAAISNHIGGLTRDFTWDTLPEKHKKRLAEKGIDQSDFEIMAASRVDNGGKDYTLLSIDDIHNVPDSVVTKHVQREIEQVQALLADKIQALQKRNEANQESILGRIKRFAGLKDRINATTDRITKQGDARIEGLVERNKEIADRLRTFLDSAEVETEIAAIAGKQKSAEDSAKFMADVKRGMEYFAGRISDVATKFTARREKAKENIKDIDSLISAAERKIKEREGDLFGKDDDSGVTDLGSVGLAAKQLDEYVAKLQERINKKGQKETTKLRAERLIVEAKQNFQAVFDAANDAINMLKANKAIIEADKAPILNELKARIEQARTEMEIAQYILIEKNVDKVQSMLDTLTFRHGQVADKLQTNGEKLGFKRGMYEAKLREMVRNEGNLETKEKNRLKELNAKNEKRLAEVEKELTQYIKDMQERIAERESWIDDYEASLGSKIKDVIDNKKRDVSGKLVAAMLEEAEMAVVQPTLSSTAKMSYQKGMLVPELGALVTQFKNFPMAVYNQHLIQRLGSLEGQEKIAYGLHLMMTTTLFGGMGLILSDLIMGKDPRRVFESGNPKVTMKFALEAMAKGGGLPFLADWMNMQWDGRDPVEKLTGPGLGMAVSAGKFAASATKFAISGGDPDTKLARNALDFGRKFVPFENMWWFRAPLNNYLTAELYEMASPGHKDRMRGLAAMNNGSEYFWGMGTNARLPNFGNITK